MKKVMILAMGAVASLGMLVGACSNKAVKQEVANQQVANEEVAEAMNFDSLVVDTATQVINGKDTLKATVHIQLMVAKGEGAEKVNDSIWKAGAFTEDFLPKKEDGMTIEQKVHAFAKNFLDSYRRDCADLIKEGLARESFSYSYDVTSTVDENKKDSLYNYHQDGYIYMAGAHGSSISIARNFKMGSGDVINKASLLTKEGEKPVKELILKDLVKQFNVKDSAALKDIGMFFGMDSYVPDNFIVKPDSITFIYQSDEAAPHAMGEIRSTLSKSALAKYLK